MGVPYVHTNSENDEYAIYYGNLWIACNNQNNNLIRSYPGQDMC